jgi:hypothetical protein
MTIRCPLPKTGSTPLASERAPPPKHRAAASTREAAAQENFTVRDASDQVCIGLISGFSLIVLFSLS